MKLLTILTVKKNHIIGLFLLKLVEEFYIYTTISGCLQTQAGAAYTCFVLVKVDTAPLAPLL